MPTIKYTDINGLEHFKEKIESEIPTKTSDLTNDSGYITNQDLSNYVKNTDYASNNKGGTIKVNSVYGLQMVSGTLIGATRNYTQYGTDDNTVVIDKGTLENVIIGKDLTTKAYVDGLVGDIDTALDLINGEVIS